MATLNRVFGALQDGEVELEPSRINNIELIQEESDLPSASGGERQLEDETAYLFSGFVTSPDTLLLGDPSPLLGMHGAIDGFIHTGGATAVKGEDVGYFQADMYVHSPGGQVLDISGDETNEVLVESVSASDAAGIGNSADLGTIDGMRVPSFKGCNFEDIGSALTFTGKSDKIFFSGCPFRGVDDNGVTILEFDANFETDIVDITDCFVKGVQADTQVINVDNAATINDVFQYRGTTHDSSVTVDNILTGAAGVETVGYRVDGSYPLADSTTVGELAADSIGNTVTIPGQNQWVEVDDFSTSLGAESERVSQSSNGTLQYDAKKNEKVTISANLTVITAGDTIQVVISKNGTRQDTSLMETQSAAGVPVPVTVEGIEDAETGDEFEIQIQNVDSASDIEVRTFNMNLTKA